MKKVLLALGATAVLGLSGGGAALAVSHDTPAKPAPPAPAPAPRKVGPIPAKPIPAKKVPAFEARKPKGLVSQASSTKTTTRTTSPYAKKTYTVPKQTSSHTRSTHTPSTRKNYSPTYGGDSSSPGHDACVGNSLCDGVPFVPGGGIALPDGGD